MVIESTGPMQRRRFNFGQEDPPEEEIATHTPAFLPENPMDRVAQKAMSHVAAKSWTRFS